MKLRAEGIKERPNRAKESVGANIAKLKSGEEEKSGQRNGDYLPTGAFDIYFWTRSQKSLASFDATKEA